MKKNYVMVNGMRTEFTEGFRQCGTIYSCTWAQRKYLVEDVHGFSTCQAGEINDARRELARYGEDIPALLDRPWGEGFEAILLDGGIDF